MSETNKKLDNNEFIPCLEDLSNNDDFNFPSDEDFLNNNDEHFFGGLPLEKVNSPKPGEQAPSPFFPRLAVSFIFS